jgi:hypothetical protein
MYLAKLYSKNGSEKVQNLTFEKVPLPYLMKNGKLYSLINNQLVPDEGYKATYCYACVTYQNLAQE